MGVGLIGLRNQLDAKRAECDVCLLIYKKDKTPNSIAALKKVHTEKDEILNKIEFILINGLF